jgi:hypothetical protein
MGVIKRGVLGGFSGKVANIIGGSWKGIAYMRSMPLSVANPRTAGQVAQRGKLGVLVTVAKVLLVDIIKPLNDRFAKEMSGYNLFVMRNITFGESISWLYQNMKISEGNLTGFQNLGASAGTSTVIGFTWSNNSSVGNANASDRVFITVYDETENQYIINSSFTRGDLVATVSFANPVGAGVTVFAVLTFLSADGTRVANSVNVPITMP